MRKVQHSLAPSWHHGLSLSISAEPDCSAGLRSGEALPGQGAESEVSLGSPGRHDELTVLVVSVTEGWDATQIRVGRSPA